MANDGVNGQELWKSDGTSAGTVLVKNIGPGNVSGAPAELSVVNGTLFFSAADFVSGRELWRSDGTAAGTVLVKDIAPGSQSSDPSTLTNGNGTLFFAATAFDGRLWKSDGTAAGTSPVYPGYPYGVQRIPLMKGTLFFAAVT